MGSVSLVIAKNSTGSATGLSFWNVGGCGMSLGSSALAAFIADCTSFAAPPMSRSSLNWTTICVAPRTLTDVSSVTPEIAPMRRSSGVATRPAIVSGAAPGRAADSTIVGKSIAGNGPTGSVRHATIPVSAMPIAISDVPRGRRMKNANSHMLNPRRRTAASARSVRRSRGGRGDGAAARDGRTARR